MPTRTLLLAILLFSLIAVFLVVGFHGSFEFAQRVRPSAAVVGADSPEFQAEMGKIREWNIEDNTQRSRAVAALQSAIKRS